MPNANDEPMNSEYSELSDLRDYLTETLTDDDSVRCMCGECFHEVWLSPSDIQWIVDQINKG